MADMQKRVKCETELTDIIAAWLEGGATDSYMLRTPVNVEVFMARAAMQVLDATDATYQEDQDAL